jgi:hypothetical protein
MSIRSAHARNGQTAVRDSDSLSPATELGAAYAHAINALHLLGAAEAKYFGASEPHAVAARTDADNLHQRAKRRMQKVMRHLMNAANDV